MESFFKVFKPSKKESEIPNESSLDEDDKIWKHNSEEDLFSGMDFVKEENKSTTNHTSALLDIKDLNINLQDPNEIEQEVSSKFSFLDVDESSPGEASSNDDAGSKSMFSFLEEDEEKDEGTDKVTTQPESELMNESTCKESSTRETICSEVSPLSSANQSSEKKTKRRRTNQPGFANQKSQSRNQFAATTESVTESPGEEGALKSFEENDIGNTGESQDVVKNADDKSIDSHCSFLAGTEVTESNSTDVENYQTGSASKDDNNQLCDSLCSSDAMVSSKTIQEEQIIGKHDEIKITLNRKQNINSENDDKVNNCFKGILLEAPLTDFENLSLQLDLLKARENEIRDHLNSYITRQKTFIEKWKTENVSEELILKKIEALKVKQNEYEQIENYDKAIEMTVEIQQLEEKYESYRFQHPLLSSDVSSLITDYLHSFESQRNQKDDILKRYEDLYRVFTVKPKESNRNEWHKYETIILKHKEKILKLGRQLSHVQLDKEHLLKNEETLNEEIIKRTKGFHVEKDSLNEKREKVQSKISELRAKLLKLEEEDSFYTSEINQINTKIDDIINEFQPKIQSIQSERELLEKEEQAVQNEIQIESKKEEDLKEKVEEERRIKEKHDNSLENLKNYIEELKGNDTSKPPVHLNDIVNMENMQSALGQKYISTKQNLKNMKEELVVLTTKLLEEETKQRNLQRNVNEIENQLSELQKMKQVAVKDRNFNVAKKLSEEIKQVTLDGESKQRYIEQLLPVIKQRKNDIEMLELKVKVEEKTCSELKKVQDERLLSGLSEIVSDINRFLKTNPDIWLASVLQLEVDYCSAIIKNLKADVHVKKNEETPQSLQPTTETLEDLETQLEQAVNMEDWDRAESLNKQIEHLKLEL